MLVAGGVDYSRWLGEIYGYEPVGKRSVEVFDPSSGVWTAVAPMSGVRAGAQAVLLADGRVAVIGGGEYGGLAAEIYDPNNDQWQAVPSPVWDGSGYAATALLDDGRLLVVRQGSREVLLLNPKTMKWESGPALDFPPTALLGRLGNDVALFAAGPDGRSVHFLRGDHWERADAAGDVTPRATLSGGTVGSKFLVLGGEIREEEYGWIPLASATLYSRGPNGIRAAPAGRLRFPRTHVTTVTLKTGELMVIGGGSPYDLRIGEVEIFDEVCLERVARE